ncbi:MAG: hypothetical protein NVSMB31_05690 [Vulcanimicrobiaceae bacterium]
MFKTIRFLAVSFLAVGVIQSAALADPYADMTKVQKAFYAVHSFRGEISNPKLKKPMELEFVAPDRYHMTTPAGDQYIIGDTMYMHVGGMSMKLPAKSMTGMIGNIRSLAAGQNLKADYTIAYLGTTSMGGQTLRMYSYTKKSDPSIKVKMYVAPDNLPRRNEVTGKDGLATVITYKDFNAPITINP